MDSDIHGSEVGSTEYSIGPVEPAWASCLTSIAFAAKAHWGYPAHWLYAWREALTLTPRQIRESMTRACIFKNTLVGFYSVTWNGHTADLRHLWILPATMSQGIGRALFAHAESAARAAGCLVLEIEAEPHAQGFYTRMGASIVGYHEGQVEGTLRRLPLMTKSLVC